MLFSYIKTSFKVFEYYHSYTTIFWLVALSYLLINPAILYGKEHLKKIVRKEELTSNKLWRFKPIEKIKPIDAILHEKISENVIDLIHKIESFVSIYYENSKEILDFDTLSKGTNVLPYHLNYIFNYYCLFSKNDFFNYYKIRYALQLIEKGYLQNKTINALVKECNFNNKKTFYNNFQKFNTKNPMEINILTKYKM
jgi:AraC-like DNA-binding protein